MRCPIVTPSVQIATDKGSSDSFGFDEEIPKNQGYVCASKNGFSIHVATSIKAHERDRLEQLLRYLGRRPVAHDKMSLDQQGNTVPSAYLLPAFRTKIPSSSSISVAAFALAMKSDKR